VVRGAELPAARLLVHPAMRALREVQGIDGDVLAALLLADHDLPLEVVGVSAGRRTQWHEGTINDAVIDPELRALLAAAQRLPRLRHLLLDGGRSEVPRFDWLVESPLAVRLERLALGGWRGRLADYHALATRLMRLERLDVRQRDLFTQFGGPREKISGWTYALERGPDGAFSILTATLAARPGYDWHAQQLLADLAGLEPSSLAQLTVATMPPRLTRAALEEAAARFPRLSSLAVGEG
jgi:hypothetical protein